MLDPKKLKIMIVMGNAALTKAVLMFLGVLTGLGLGLWYIIILANRFNKSQSED